MKYVILFVLLFVSSIAHADPDKDPKRFEFLTNKSDSLAPQSSQDSDNSLPKLIDITSSLLVVLVVIGLLAWGFKRYMHIHTTTKGCIKIVGGTPLGARERLVLVQVGNKQLLLGVTPGRIDNLHTLEEPIPLSTVDEPMPGKDSFSAKLSKILSSK